MLNKQQRAERRAMLVKAVETKHPADVAQAFGVSITTVLNACRRAGEPWIRQRKLSTLEIIADFCNTTIPLARLAKKHKRCEDAVYILYRRALRVGIPVKRRHPGRPKNAG